MKSTLLKSVALAGLLSVSGVTYAQEQAVSVNTEGMPAYLAAKVQAKAQEGPSELRRFVWRTRMIYALDLVKIVRVV
jgi:hypothetical protein